MTFAFGAAKTHLHGGEALSASEIEFTSCSEILKTNVLESMQVDYKWKPTHRADPSVAGAS